MLGGLENFAGDVALDASHDFFFGFAFGEAAGDVVTGGLVAAHAHDQDVVQCAVGVAVAASVEAVADRLPLEASSGQTPQSLAKAASLQIRSGLSPIAVSSVAAVSGPTP